MMVLAAAAAVMVDGCMSLDIHHMADIWAVVLVVEVVVADHHPVAFMDGKFHIIAEKIEF